jgi:hypothetical protein
MTEVVGIFLGRGARRKDDMVYLTT